MSARQREQEAASAGIRRAIFLSVALSGLAAVIAVGALALALSRGSGQGECATVAWGAIPEARALPAGWSMVSNRVFIDNLSTTLLGPAPSGATQASAVYVSLSCYGSDGATAFRRAHDGALAAGASDVSFASLGDESFAVHSAPSSNTTVFIRHGALVADLTAPVSVDDATLAAIARVIDAGMLRALSGVAPPSVAPAAVRSAAPVSTGSSIPSAQPAASGAVPAPSQAAASHVSPDLEAVLPHVVGSTTFTSQSILGTDALKSDAASQALVASLEKLDKTPADLEIAEAQDTSGTFKAYLFAYRVRGVTAAVLGKAVVDSLLVDASSAPKESQVTLAGHAVTKLLYASGSGVYLYDLADAVIAIETPDESLASLVLALLK